MATRRLISAKTSMPVGWTFADLDSGKRLPPVHPGNVLRHDFLEPLGLSAHALALALRVAPNRVTTILAGERAVTAETAPLASPGHFGLPAPASGSICKKPMSWK